MIYTMTLNPSIDYVMYVPDIKLGALNRAEKVNFFPGGKGINVSRVLQRLHIKNTSLGLIGGFTGNFIKEFLKEEQVLHDFVEVNEPTRINVKVKGHQETEVNGAAPTITEEHIAQIHQKVSQLKRGDYLVVAGSVPSSIPAGFLTQIAAFCRKNNVHLAVDTSEDPLKELVHHQPFLIKPNHHELSELCGIEIKTPLQAAEQAQLFINQGIEHIIISMGGQGAVYVNKDTRLYAKAPKGKLVNSVGAGDSVVAGFLACLSQGKTYENAFRFSVASGSATAFQEDLCQKEDVNELLPQVEVETI
ncbi:1-phosphofructokinase [Bacillaceae bacterium S4-13-56]